MRDLVVRVAGLHGDHTRVIAACVLVLLHGVESRLVVRRCREVGEHLFPRGTEVCGQVLGCGFPHGRGRGGGCIMRHRRAEDLDLVFDERGDERRGDVESGREDDADCETC